MAALTWPDAAHLLRCLGFGTTGTAVDALVGREAADVVRAIVTADVSADPGVTATPVPVLDAIALNSPNRSGQVKNAKRKQISDQRNAVIHWWLGRMLSVQEPVVERLTFAWHGIFATSMDKVRRPPFMLKQNETIRQNSRGDFLDLAVAMMKDPAMLFWLDGPRNRSNNPNENLARESLELFMLGHGDGYTEKDVQQTARALTGWRLDKVKVEATFDPEAWASDDKTILGVTKNFDVDSYCQLAVSRPASAPFVLGRVWSQLISDRPMDENTRNAAVQAYGSSRNVAAALTAMFSAAGFGAAAGTRVVSPVEWGVGLARTVKVDPGDEQSLTLLATTLDSLGQMPFYPPSVGGWPAGPAWLSTAAAMSRARQAEAIVARGDVSSVADAGAADRVDAAGHLLGVASWSPRSRSALSALQADPATLVAMAANTPEYLTV